MSFLKWFRNKTNMNRILLSLCIAGFIFLVLFIFTNYADAIIGGVGLIVGFIVYLFPNLLSPPIYERDEFKSLWMTIGLIVISCIIFTWILYLVVLVNHRDNLQVTDLNETENIHTLIATPLPDRMTGDFNIAVAQFGELTDKGTVPSVLAIQISKALFDFLDSDFRASDFGLKIQVAHKNIGIIEEDREAEQLAQNINADIVFYGSVSVINDGDEVALNPRFYVADLPDTQELTGTHKLEAPISFASRDKIIDELRSRAAILLHFTKGLIYFSTNNLDAAINSFQQAIREAENYEREEEVLYLSLAEAYRLQGNFEMAFEKLDQALSLNPEYARAYIARGNIYYDQALQKSFDEANLRKALYQYQEALEAQDHPAGAYIEEKAHTSIGNTLIVRAQRTNNSELFAEAIEHYNQVVTQYKRTPNEQLKDTVATAYFGSGVAYEKQENYTQAENAYRLCMKLTSDLELKSRAEKQIENLIKR